jgi:fibronectin type 3 domain-containing protein
MKMSKVLLSLLLAICIVFSMLPVFTVEAHADADDYGYDRAAALEYATANWSNNSGHCDWFVKDCLRAGNIACNIENAAELTGTHAYEFLPSDVTPLRQGLLDLHYGSEVAIVLSGSRAQQSENPSVTAGDVVFWYCSDCGKYFHVGLIGGTNDEGNLFFYAHNPSTKSDYLGFSCPSGHSAISSSVIHFSAYQYDHEHCFRIRQIEQEHPHHMFASCTHSGCDAKFYHGFNGTYGSCTICNPPAGENPILTVTLNDENKPILRWTTVLDGSPYTVSRARSVDGTYFDLASITGTSLLNSAVSEGVTYYYKVTSNTGKVSNIVSITIPSVPSAGSTPLAAPIISGHLNTNGKPVISWNTVSGATKYDLYRSVNGGSYSKLISTPKLSVTNSTATSGNTYSFKVQAVSDAGTSAFSNVITLSTGLAAPVISGHLNANGKPVISWNTVSGATAYEVYRSINGGEYSLLISTTKLSVTNTSVVAGTIYYYKVRAVSSTGTGLFSNIIAQAIG